MGIAIKFLLLAGALSTTLSAAASEQLAQKYACVACHHAERKLIGPSWKSSGANSQRSWRHKRHSWR